MALIKQSDNFTANFGLTFAVALFWVPLELPRSLVLSNYWKYKNNIQNIAIVVTFRRLNGTLIAREVPVFGGSDVLVINSQN